ncbi:MAG: very short patch repair endonuclease [Demequina sp.]|nr:very short patch repair endonuclease [Demequina sp.]
MSWASSEGTRRSMVANRGRDTGPELAVRRRLHEAGLRYRVAQRPDPALRRTADIVFRPVKVAVFIDGCFWHGCPTHYTSPATHSDYWSPKILRTQQRDRETDARLRSAGWLVLRFWEHEDADQVALSIESAVTTRRKLPSS